MSYNKNSKKPREMYTLWNARPLPNGIRLGILIRNWKHLLSILPLYMLG